MKHLPIQQEILLIKTSSVARQELCIKKDNSGTKHLSATEQLEQACWDGLLSDMLPGVLNTTASGKPLFLWQIQEETSCLHIVLCEAPLMCQYDESIDPHTFLLFVAYN